MPQKLGDPWVQYSDVVGDLVGMEERGREKWSFRYGNPRAIPRDTFHRVQSATDAFLDDAKNNDKIRVSTGVIKPGIDPLPHHYVPSLHKVLRPHMLDYEAAASRSTRPTSVFVQPHKCTYMSMASSTMGEELKQSPDPNKEHLSLLRSTKALLAQQLEKVSDELTRFPDSSSSPTRRKLSRPRASTSASAWAPRAPFATPNNRSTRRVLDVTRRHRSTGGNCPQPGML